MFGRTAAWDGVSRDEARVRRGFWDKARRVARKLPFAEDLLAAYYCAFDRQTPAAGEGRADGRACLFRAAGRLHARYPAAARLWRRRAGTGDGACAWSPATSATSIARRRGRRWRAGLTSRARRAAPHGGRPSTSRARWTRRRRISASRQFDAAEKICARVLKAQPKFFDALHLDGRAQARGRKAGGGARSFWNPPPSSIRSRRNSCPISPARLRRSTAMRRRWRPSTKHSAGAGQSGSCSTAAATCCLSLTAADEAIAVFERALAIEPRFLNARASLGNALCAARATSRRRCTHYDAVLAVHPSHAETHYNRANALASLGRNADALAAYAQALALRDRIIHARRSAAASPCRRSTGTRRRSTFSARC